MAVAEIWENDFGKNLKRTHDRKNGMLVEKFEFHGIKRGITCVLCHDRYLFREAIKLMQ